MDKKWLAVAAVTLPLAVGGLVLARSPTKSGEKTQQVEDDSYICPLTGEELPCSCCCPLNKNE
jgi:hypothetical protein